MVRNILSIFLVIFIIFSSFNSSEQSENTYISFNGNLYSYKTDKNEKYTSQWYPQSRADLSADAYSVTKSDLSENEKNKVRIQYYSDKDLYMFIEYEEELYCLDGYDLPNYLTNSDIEEIIVTDKLGYSETSVTEYMRIKNKSDIDIITEEFRNIHNNPQDYKKVDLDNLVVFADIGIKFKQLNAVYYCGMLSKDTESGDLAFYDAHRPGNTDYIISKSSQNILNNYLR